ncbi:hypothetical protein CAPTEDRAFT_92078 [Capitella teleta]|uniref:Uncharacterized protein n=1 Tax=Capitella teleta TaxID=283909 RepID=R7TY76_CAPTE|nr:hypothetical protein CAPTEDRAFT_92078 [Capitella teleta]|eukprot:ELT95915.1 hypothetical protein CAPTEDRAFT_92078 [Capitella teleta]
MFLHPAYEVPQVRDLGFAVAPGTHTLVGIQLSRASNLPDPWGDCAETNLTLFTNYTYSGCLLQDETMTLNDSCQCRDAYMPAGGGFEREICIY